MEGIFTGLFRIKLLNLNITLELLFLLHLQTLATNELKYPKMASI